MMPPNFQEHIDNIQLIIEDFGNKITSNQAPNLKVLEFQISELFTAVSRRGTVSSDKHHEKVFISLKLMAEKMENLECLLEEIYERGANKFWTL